MPNIPTSVVENIGWPAIPTDTAAQGLALFHQFDRSQWWSPEQLWKLQKQKLIALVRHAYEHVPYYRDYGAESSIRELEHDFENTWGEIAILKRSRAAENAARLVSENVPTSHGSPEQKSTSGSTGVPMSLFITPISALLCNISEVRITDWHQFDLTKSLALIRDVKTKDPRSLYPNGLHSSRWVIIEGMIFPTGESRLLNCKATPEQQIEWLQWHKPGYLTTFTSNALYLAETAKRMGIEMPWLRAIVTYGEMTRPDVRMAICENLSVDLIDHYSSQDAGSLAVQCHDCGRLHVQCENVFLEVLNDDDRPCQQGEVGRVVVTPLNNYATVLLRYEIGDLAEVGGAATCGRGLPTLVRIVGRFRQGLQLPGGNRMFPDLGTIRPIMMEMNARRFQIVQTQTDHLEVRLETKNETSHESKAKELIDHIKCCFPSISSVALSYTDKIPVGPSGKFEDFICQIARV